MNIEQPECHLEAYATTTTTKKNIEALREHGWRLLLTPDTVERGACHYEMPYALDNGAFGCYQQGIPFDEKRFKSLLYSYGPGADWVVVPDVVANRPESLRLTFQWLPECQRYCPRVLLAVQDGMIPEDIINYLGPQVGIFVGGTVEWKLESMPMWGELAAFCGCYLHVGRVNTVNRIQYCKEVGAHSFDGTSASKWSVNVPKLDKARRCPPMNKRDWVHLLYGNTMDVVASTIRAGITAPPGKVLVVSDLASIESRVLGWMSGCERMNRIFAEGKDTYVDFAQEMFHCSYDEVTKEQRTTSKPAVLGCGYQLGADGLKKYAESMNVAMTKDECKHAVRTFRSVYREIPAMWSWLTETCKSIILNGGETLGYTVHIHRDENFLFIRLPSGQPLHYYQPHVEPRVITIVDDETGEERKWETMAVTYMGQNTYTHQWERISTHGGKITENIVQAIARDILAGV